MRNRHVEITSAGLHWLAMACMLCDHLWGTVVAGQDWLTCIGRLAFPIFAFLLVEGYFHTKNLRRYAGRLLLFAILSEIPFNLAIGSALFYPLHQNVLWSFLIALGLMHLCEKTRARRLWLRLGAAALAILLAVLLGLLTFVDYYHAGLLTVLVFYFFRGRRWWCRLGQLLGLAYINLELLGGLVYPIPLFGGTLDFPRQGLALLSLIPIWLYRGKQGPHSRALRAVNYLFYPVHLLVLAIIKLL